MGLIFKDDLLDEFGTWPLAYMPYGGADFGEILAIAETAGDGNETDFYNAFITAADRFVTDAEEALQNGYRAVAKELYLKASEFYTASYHPIYGSPVDARLLTAFDKQVTAFDKAMALSNPPVTPIRIPFESTTMPAYLIPAKNHASEKKPLIIFTNGYDATITDMYFASSVAASERGYHCLLFDGPGQGELLYKQNIPLRADWETVITAVVDFALTLPDIDASKIILHGWSLGSYLALRGASGEQRIAACIADPGLSDVGYGFTKALQQFGATSEQAAYPASIDQSILDRIMRFVESNRSMKWKIVQRGFWANGVDNIRDFLVKSNTFTLEGRVNMIKCATLLTAAENDRVNTIGDIESFFNKLQCPKDLIKFYANRGAGDHCEMNNRSLVNRKILDWVDSVINSRQKN